MLVHRNQADGITLSNSFTRLQKEPETRGKASSELPVVRNAVPSREVAGEKYCEQSLSLAYNLFSWLSKDSEKDGE